MPLGRASALALSYLPQWCGDASMRDPKARRVTSAKVLMVVASIAGVAGSRFGVGTSIGCL